MLLKLTACSAVLTAVAAVLAHRWLLDTPLPDGLEDPEPLRRAVATQNFVFYASAALWMAGATKWVFEPAKLMVQFARRGNAAVEFQGLETSTEFVERADGTQLAVKFDRPQKKPRQVDSSGEAARACILFLHGGGYTLNSPAVYHPLTGNLSLSLGLPVFSPDYRKSPQWTHPAALNDALAAIRHLRAAASRYNIDPNRILLAGDSAGGHLAIGATLSLLKAGEEPPAGLVLVYPATQLLSTSLPSHLENRLDPFLPESTATAFRLGYLVGDTADLPVWKANNHSSPAVRAAYAEKFQLPLLANRGPSEQDGDGLAWAIDKYRFTYEDWLLSPLFAPRELLARFPPTLTQTCQFDVLRDEGEMFHQRLVRAGVAGAAHSRFASVHAMYGFGLAGHKPALRALAEFKTFVTSVMGLTLKDW